MICSCNDDTRKILIMLGCSVLWLLLVCLTHLSLEFKVFFWNLTAQISASVCIGVLYATAVRQSMITELPCSV